MGGGVVHNFAPLQVTCQESLLFHHVIGTVEAEVKEGDMGVYGIAVLGFFPCGISVIANEQAERRRSACGAASLCER